MRCKFDVKGWDRMGELMGELMGRLMGELMGGLMGRLMGELMGAASALGSVSTILTGGIINLLENGEGLMCSTLLYNRTGTQICCGGAAAVRGNP